MLRNPQPKELTLLLDPAPGRWIEEALGSRLAAALRMSKRWCRRDTKRTLACSIPP